MPDLPIGTGGVPPCISPASTPLLLPPDATPEGIERQRIVDAGLEPALIECCLALRNVEEFFCGPPCLSLEEMTRRVHQLLIGIRFAVNRAAEAVSQANDASAPVPAQGVDKGGAK